MDATYYERRYCFICLKSHFVEVTRRNVEICHGENFIPRDTPTHYTRHRGRGVELVEKCTRANMAAARQLPLDWQMLADAKE